MGTLSNENQYKCLLLNYENSTDLFFSDYKNVFLPLNHCTSQSTRSGCDNSLQHKNGRTSLWLSQKPTEKKTEGNLVTLCESVLFISPHLNLLLAPLNKPGHELNNHLRYCVWELLSKYVWLSLSLFAFNNSFPYFLNSSLILSSHSKNCFHWLKLYKMTSMNEQEKSADNVLTGNIILFLFTSLLKRKNYEHFGLKIEINIS